MIGTLHGCVTSETLYYFVPEVPNSKHKPLVNFEPPTT